MKVQARARRLARPFPITDGINTDRKGCMLVLARKKHEAILIDGVIRIEVVNVGKATVRVRLRAPRGMPSLQGLAPKNGLPREASPARVVPVGMDEFLMTLLNQQVVNLGESISLGVVDADKSRALFFVDAPLGMSVTALKHQGDDRPSLSSRQNLLQFMGQAGEMSGPNCDQPAPGAGAEFKNTSIEEPEPKLLPFPARLPKRHRL
jgi:Global regulator protein family